MASLRLLATALASTTLMAAAAPADAASSYDGCTGFITTLPATLTTQGVWCFQSDLATSQASGPAITIAANNITVDCNGFKLGGLAAGIGTTAVGIYADGRSNSTVRDCNIRGFYAGVQLGDENSSGHRVEGNRFEANTGLGVIVQSSGGLIRDNVLIDTGGTPITTFPYIVAIVAVDGVDVIGNQVAGVAAVEAAPNAAAIVLGAPVGVVAAGNRVSGLVSAIGGIPVGLAVEVGGTADIRDNSFVNAMPGISVYCSGVQFLHGNALMMGEPAPGCLDGGDKYGWEEPL